MEALAGKPVGGEGADTSSVHSSTQHSLLNDSHVSCTSFLHELTVCLFYYIEETRHSLRNERSGDKGCFKVGEIAQLLSQASMGSDPGHSCVTLTGCFPSSGLSSLLQREHCDEILITDDMGATPERATLTEQGVRCCNGLPLFCLLSQGVGEVGGLKETSCRG